MAFGRRSRVTVSNPNAVSKHGAESLTAAGARLRAGAGLEADSYRRLQQGWQGRSLTYYDIVPEVKSAGQFHAKGIGKLELFAGKYNDDGELERTEDTEAVEMLDRMQDPGGGRSGLLSQYARLRFLVGEALLTVTTDEEDGSEQWEMLSPDEIRPTTDGRGYRRLRAPSTVWEEYKAPTDDDFVPLGKEAIVYRLYQQHPRWSSLADCNMRGVLDVCEELVLLTQAVRAKCRSRLAGAGILFIDDRISKAPPEPAPGEDPVQDKFVMNLVNAMTASIQDEGVASAVTPLVVRVPVPDGMSCKEMVSHLALIDATQVYPEVGMRFDTIRRLAMNLDLPPESLLGLAHSNHWTAWMVDEQAWTQYLEPFASALVSDLSAAYYRPSLKKAGVKDWQKYAIGYDASKIVVRPDRTKDAKELHDKGVISDEALRNAANFDEKDAPSEAERWVYLSIRSRDPHFALTGETSSAPPPEEPVDDEEENGVGEADRTPGDVEPGPPEKDDSVEESNGNGNENVAAILGRILGASDLALLRAREAAGNRILTSARRDPDMAKLIEGVPTRDLAATLGRERVRSLRVPSDAELVTGARALINEALRQWGLSDEVTALVGRSIEQHAIRTLYDMRPAPLPAAFENYVTGALATPA